MNPHYQYSILGDYSNAVESAPEDKEQISNSTLISEVPNEKSEKSVLPLIIIGAGIAVLIFKPFK